jgi:cell division protein FtsI/penicillin-binding protein 2
MTGFKRFSMLLPVLLAIFLTGCRIDFTNLLPAPTSPVPTQTAILVQLPVTPGAVEAAREYLEAWKNEDYAKMYSLLTALSKDAIDETRLTQRYREVTYAAALTNQEGESPISYEILSVLVNPGSGQVSYRVNLNSFVFGSIHRETVMNLRLEEGEWRIQWDDTLILPELAGGNYLKLEYRTPARGNIYDQQDRALVAQSSAVALGINTLNLDPENDQPLVDILVEMSKGQFQEESLKEKINDYRSRGWYLPVADFSTETVIDFDDELQSIPGVVMQAYRSRYYFDGGPVSAAPHITGYMGPIQPNELEYYRRMGYSIDDRVGRAGLELWAEPYLSGKKGGSLYVVTPAGAIVTKLAEVPAVPSQSVYMTINKDLQEEVQKALTGLRGAVVVQERDTGRILAMASSPGFNPNLFEPTNFNSELLSSTLYNETNPLLNRATQGQYPLGSVFKIITMAAGIESGQFRENSEYQCGYFFREIPGVTLNDWTYEYYLQDGRTQPSGLLTLSRGLTKSCNPFFWHVGVDLFNRGLTNAVSDMALGFGLGEPTGIEIPEAAGRIPVPTSQIDAANFSIGQGETLVTPLQVANFTAALGNGGTLYRPQLVERIVTPDGETIQVFTPTVLSELPVGESTRSAIHDALAEVVGPQGTARSVGAYLTSYSIPAAGKTGTAQSGGLRPHAWFAGYTFAERDEQPDIAVAVVIENGGEGSMVAAPIFQAAVKLYFYGPPRNIFPWEIQPGETMNSDSTP